MTYTKGMWQISAMQLNLWVKLIIEQIHHAYFLMIILCYMQNVPNGLNIDLDTIDNKLPCSYCSVSAAGEISLSLLSELKSCQEDR